MSLQCGGTAREQAISWQGKSSPCESNTAEFPVALHLLETVYAGAMPVACLLSLRAVFFSHLQPLKTLQDNTSSGPVGPHRKKILDIFL